MAKTTTKAASEAATPLNIAGDERDALYAQFINDCTDAGLKPIEVEDLSVCGRLYTGPVVNVRDLDLVRQATKCLTLTAASGEDTFYVLPLLESIDLE